jgi:hypothetical protein
MAFLANPESSHISTEIVIVTEYRKKLAAFRVVFRKIDLSYSGYA